MSTWHGKVEFNPYKPLIRLLCKLDIKAAQKLTPIDISWLHTEMKLRTARDEARKALKANSRSIPDIP